MLIIMHYCYYHYLRIIIITGNHIATACFHFPDREHKQHLVHNIFYYLSRIFPHTHFVRLERTTADKSHKEIFRPLTTKSPGHIYGQ